MKVLGVAWDARCCSWWWFYKAKDERGNCRWRCNKIAKHKHEKTKREDVGSSFYFLVLFSCHPLPVLLLLEWSSSGFRFKFSSFSWLGTHLFGIQDWWRRNGMTREFIVMTRRSSRWEEEWKQKKKWTLSLFLLLVLVVPEWIQSGNWTCERRREWNDH